MKMSVRILLSVVLSSLLLACFWVLRFPETIIAHDHALLSFFVGTHTTWSLILFGLFTEIGSWYGVLAVLGLLGVVMRHEKRFIFYYQALLVLVISTGGVVYLLKDILHRSRPANVIPFFTESSYSFPSGHAALACVLYGFLWYWFSREQYLTFSRRVLLVTMILGISFSRVYVGVHYVSDVVGGILIGFLMLLLWVFVIDKRRQS